MTYVARWTCPQCGYSSDVLHYHDTQAPVLPCPVCRWSLSHDEAMRRIEVAAQSSMPSEKRTR